MGKQKKNAAMFYPLNIAPVGVFGGEKFDFEMNLVYPSQKPDEDDWILNKPDREVKSVWKITSTVSMTICLKDRPFTPLAAWNRFVAAQYYKAFKKRQGRQSRFGCSLSLFKTVMRLMIKNRFGRLNMKSPIRLLLELMILKKNNSILFCKQSVSNPTMTKKSPKASLTVDVTLKNFLDQDGAVVRRRFRLLKYKNNSPRLELPPVDKTTAETQPIFRFAVQDVVLEKKTEQQRSRVGALNIHFAESWKPEAVKPPQNPQLDNEDLEGTLTAGLRGLKELKFSDSDLKDLIDKLEDAIPRFYNPSIEAEIPLLLSGLSPGGQDPLPQEIADKNERFPETIIVPVGDSAAQKIIEGFFVLVANEKSRSQENQSLALRLEKFDKTNASSSVSKISFIVVDQHPFLITKVSADINFADEVGNWDDAESFWELADTGKSFELILPPQVVGEEFIKDYKNFPNPATAEPERTHLFVCAINFRRPPFLIFCEAVNDKILPKPRVTFVAFSVISRAKSAARESNNSNMNCSSV